MRLILNFLILILGVEIIQSSIYTNLQQNILSFIQNIKDGSQTERHSSKNYHAKGLFSEAKKHKDLRMNSFSNRAMKAKKSESEVMERHTVTIPHTGVTKSSQHRYHMDPVMNFIRRRANHPFRRTQNLDESVSDSSSSSVEENLKWKDEWKQHWVHKKFEAINASYAPVGDTVNMVAARPWGVPCGDPNQHDLPWGSCMLPMECESEYRIYRGDYFCGRTQFVCCALSLTNYDMYQAFDVSFGDSDLSTDSEERKQKGKGSKEKKKRKKLRAKKRRRRARIKRKRRIKKTIRKMIKEITRILNRSYRNSTYIRKKKTNQLKKFIKELKKQYKKDRKSVKDVHEKEMLHVDAALESKLKKMKELNINFMNNVTFRDIIVNGTINTEKADLLFKQYPELRSMIRARRSGGGEDVDDSMDNLEYDIEYGMLYY